MPTVRQCLATELTSELAHPSAASLYLPEHAVITCCCSMAFCSSGDIGSRSDDSSRPTQMITNTSSAGILRNQSRAWSPSRQRMMRRLGVRPHEGQAGRGRQGRSQLVAAAKQQ